jgi:hypothetical protein
MKKFDFKLTRRHLIYIIIGSTGLLIIALFIFISMWKAVSSKILSQAEPSRVDTSKTSESSASNQPAQETAVEEGMIYEGFEGGVMPPTGWGLYPTNITYTWKIATIGPPYTGTYKADVEYDPGFNDQDEFLLSPTFWGDTGSVSFWSNGSVYWCKDTYDKCDLEVWFIGERPGPGDDVLLGKADDSWTESWTWANSIFDFSPYLNGWGQIGFRYVGNDGAQISLDHITITYAGNVPTFLPAIFNINNLTE